jgi:hypothetical protein
MSFVQTLFGWQYRGWAAVAAVALTLFFVFVLFPRATAKTGSTRNSVVDLQKAYTPEMFVEVLRGWSRSKAEAVGVMKRENIVKLDLIFPVLYALAFALSYAALSGRPQPTPLDFVLFVAPLVAGLFDYIENGLHLYLLRGVDNAEQVEQAARAGAFSPSLVFAASVFAHAKYVLLGVGLVALAGALVQLIRARF